MGYIQDFIKNIGFGTGVNRVKVDDNGLSIMEGKASGWNDYTANFNEAKLTGVNDPTWVQLPNGFYLAKFAFNDAAHLSYHVLHDIHRTEKMYPHIHWAPETVVPIGETVIWEFKILPVKGHHQAESFNGSPITRTLTYVGDGTEIAYEHMILETPLLDAIDAVEVDGIIDLIVTYKGGTYTGDVHGKMADFHYRQGTHGTLNKAPNFYE